MTQEKLVNLKRMKHLFLIFLKQFEVDEYKLLMQFLQLIINKYNLNPSTLFGFLTNQIEKDEDFSLQAMCKTSLDFENSSRQQMQYETTISKNRRYQQIKRKRPIEQTKPEHVSFLQNTEVQLDEECFRFHDNDDDTDIDYLDENYNEPLTSGVASLSGTSEFNIEMLKDRTDILDSFVMKPKVTSDEEADEEQNVYEDELCDENQLDNETQLNEEFDETGNVGEAYYGNELEDEDYYNEQYLNNGYSFDQQTSQCDLSFQKHPYRDYNQYTDNGQYTDQYKHNEFYNNQDEFDDTSSYQGDTSSSQTPCTSNMANNYWSRQIPKITADVTQFDSKLRVRKFSEAIRSELERKFIANNFISGVEKTQLAKKLNLTERQVQKWFVHRREKLRRLEKKAGIVQAYNQPKTKAYNQPKGNATSSSVTNSTTNMLQLALNQALLQPNISSDSDRLTSQTIKNCSKPETNPAQPKRSRPTNRQKLNEFSTENPYKKFYLTRKSTDSHSLKVKEENLDREVQHKNHIDEENSNYEAINGSFSYEKASNFNQSMAEECSNENYPANGDGSFVDYENQVENLQFDENSQEEIEFKVNGDHQFDADLSGMEEDDTPSKKTFKSDQNQKFLQHYLTYNSSPKSDQLIRPTKRKCLTVPRRLFPPHVVTHLESLFDMNKYIKECQIEEISRVTNLNEKQIRSWFKQRRFRYNLENREKNSDQDYDIKHLTNLPKHVITELEEAFLKNNYVYGNDKKHLSRQLNLKPIQLERWFYYRRKKLTSRLTESAAPVNLSNNDDDLD